MFMMCQNMLKSRLFHEDQEEQGVRADFDLNVQDEVTEQDIIHIMLFQGDAAYKEETGVVFHSKGNRMLPWSDEEDESQEKMTGSGRPGGSRDESGHERARKGQEQMLGRDEQVGGDVEGVFEGLLVCCRLAPNELIHACAGNPVLFSKVRGQVLQAVDDVQAILQQGDREAVLSILGACSVRS